MYHGINIQFNTEQCLLASYMYTMVQCINIQFHLTVYMYTMVLTSNFIGCIHVHVSKANHHDQVFHKQNIYRFDHKKHEKSHQMSMFC